MNVYADFALFLALAAELFISTVIGIKNWLVIPVSTVFYFAYVVTAFFYDRKRTFARRNSQSNSLNQTMLEDNFSLSVVGPESSRRGMGCCGHRCLVWFPRDASARCHHWPERI